MLRLIISVFLNLHAALDFIGWMVSFFNFGMELVITGITRKQRTETSLFSRGRWLE